MMHIHRVTLREIRLPLREPFRISSGAVTDRRIILAELEDRDSCTVWSECVAGEWPNYSAETVDTAWLALRDWFIPRLLDTPLNAPQSAAPLLLRDVRGHRMAAATLEMGVWALYALREQLSLSRLIGGTREQIECGISLGIQQSPDDLVERARAAMQEGYLRIKMKIRPGADVEYVTAVRTTLGAEAPLMVDANNAYTAGDIDVLTSLDDLGLLMIEQPLDHDDLVRHARLQRRLATPICLDESITTVDRATDMISTGAGRIINIKAGRVGGFAEAIAIHDVCTAAGVPVWCGGMLESGIGRAYNVALASLPGFTMPGDTSPSSRYWTQDIVDPAWSMSADGMMDVPAAPGLGVDIDVDRIDDLTVRREEFEAG